EKILVWAAPGLIPTGAAGQNGLAPAVLEAVDRYTKSSSADLLELGFRLAWEIGRDLHWLQQKLITVTLPRVFGEWPYENAELGEVRRPNFRRARLQACGREGNGRFRRWHARQ